MTYFVYTHVTFKLDTSYSPPLAHTLDKYWGKHVDREYHQKVTYYRQIKKLNIRETADATGDNAITNIAASRRCADNQKRDVLVKSGSLYHDGEYSHGLWI